MSDTSIDLLVKADFLYPMSKDLPVVRAGEVAVDNGAIVYAGPAKGGWSARRVIDKPGSAVLPGFVNAHTHTASIVFRSQTDDYTAGAVLTSLAFRMEKDVTDEEWGALGDLGCIEMLKAGVTTINDIWYSPWRLAESVERSGLRAQIANKVFDVRLENLHGGDYTRYTEIGEKRLRDGVEFAKKWNSAAGGRIATRLGPHAVDTLRPEFHKEVRAEATRLGIGLHIHTAQSAKEVALIRDSHGCGSLEYLRDLGVLAPDVVCAHATFADDADIAAMAQTGARYAHCPTIYPRRGLYPRLDDIRRAGVTTGFGTDWMQNDPFSGMRNAINMMRKLMGNPDYMPCAEALWLHTMGAAGVLGIDDQVGSLEAGKRADLILIDLNKPHLQPYYGDYAALVFYACASDVSMSVIDGQIVLEDGEPTRMDSRAALARVQNRTPHWATNLLKLGSRCVCCG